MLKYGLIATLALGALAACGGAETGAAAEDTVTSTVNPAETATLLAEVSSNTYELEKTHASITL